MKKHIETIVALFNKYPNLKQWAWFVILWAGGMLAFVVAAYPIKFIINSLG